jgi:hypothetical protein
MALDTVNITQFSNLLNVKAQQMTTRLMGRCQIIPITGENFAYDGVGDLAAKTNNSRNPLIDPQNPDYNRRKLTTDRILVELIVDNRDVRRMFEDPSSKLVNECMYAIMRKSDKVGITALHASVYTGKEFGTTTTYAADGGQTVDATAGLTFAKLLEIKDNFKKYDVGLDMPEDILFGITEQEETKMLQLSQLTSRDFTGEYVVDKGKVAKVMGMDVILFGSGADAPQLSVSSSVRDNFACSTKGLIYGMSKEFSVTVIENHPNYVESTYIRVLGDIGAVRTNGRRVQKVQTTAV